MRRLFYTVATMLSFMSCGSSGTNDDSIQKENSNNQDEVLDTNSSPSLKLTGLDISEELIEEIEVEVGKSYSVLNEEICRFNAEDDETYILDTGLVFDFVSEDKAHKIFEEFHKLVEEEGYYLFLSRLDFDEAYNSYYDIIIMPAIDQFDIINKMGTDGLNYEIYSDDIIKNMKEWHKEVGFEICVVDEDRVEAYMTKKPNDLKKFCSRVYEFCPDVIDQGYGTMEAMLEDIEASQYFWMWWD